jgi:hypothetical protein
MSAKRPWRAEFDGIENFSRSGEASARLFLRIFLLGQRKKNCRGEKMLFFAFQHCFRGLFSFYPNYNFCLVESKVGRGPLPIGGVCDIVSAYARALQGKEIARLQLAFVVDHMTKVSPTQIAFTAKCDLKKFTSGTC